MSEAARPSVRSMFGWARETGTQGRNHAPDHHLSIAASLVALSLGGAASAQQQAPQSPNMTFFVASGGPGKGGDLGGIDAADARCQSLAKAAGAGRQSLARLSQLDAERLGRS